MDDKKEEEWKNDKLFDLLTARISTRYTITMTFATIASSASLVFIAVYYSINQLTEKTGFAILGILFPALAISYLELTHRSIISHDYDQIRELFKKNIKREYDKIEKIILYKELRKPRSVLISSLLVLPVIAWFYILFNWYGLFVIGWIFVPYLLENPSCMKKLWKKFEH